MLAYVFPGQASQFPGMGQDDYESSNEARDLYLQADEILGFPLSKVMFEGSEEDLKQTEITQPAVFLHSLVRFLTKNENNPDVVAGHSLGEFSALVAAEALDFESGLKLVHQRALAMQRACEVEKGTMAAIVGLEDGVIEEVCASTDGIVIPANYNCPGQLVISGSVDAVERANEALKEKGARRAMLLNVGGAFHSPLMETAKKDLEIAINEVSFSKPICPIYQNVDAQRHTDPGKIKENLIAQLTAPVKWTQIMQNMINDGLTSVCEVGGNGKVLRGMFKRIDRNLESTAL